MTFEYIKPANEQVIELMYKYCMSRYIRLSDIDKIPGFCKWCLDDQPNKRKQYCSEDCSKSAIACFHPQKFARGLIFRRQEGKCNMCDYFWGDDVQDTFNDEDHEMHIDHIIPISLGGFGTGLRNVQGLCKKCHYTKTIQERRMYNETI